MINLRKDYPLKRDIIDEIQQRMAMIRDLTLETEQLVHEATKKESYLTKDELRRLIRLSDDEPIPAGIKKIRVKNKYIYAEKDVIDFIESKKR